MPNKDQPPKRQNKQAPNIGNSEIKDEFHQKNTGSIVAIVIVGVLVLFAAIKYFAA